MKINGNTVGTTMPRTNYNQTDPKKADYLVGRENILGKDELASVTEEILAEAKESGEFDGKDGRDGVDGKDGYTPIKGIDYFDGKDGAKGDKGDKGDQGLQGVQGEKGDTGANGKDGISPTLSISTINGGHRIEVNDVIGIRSFVVKDGENGADGKDGADGYSPIRGTDYWTDADKASIVTDVINALPTWEGGNY